MLQTVLEIGEAFRVAKQIQYHRYIKPCPQDEKKPVFRLAIPVREDFSFDFDSVYEIDDENAWDKLFYLKFKTSESDSLVKYIFGDIHYSKSGEKEAGHYRLANLKSKAKTQQVSSFYRGDEDAQKIEKIYLQQGAKTPSAIQNFRAHYQQTISLIENILEYPAAMPYFFKNSLSISFSEYLNDIQQLIQNNAVYNYHYIQSKKVKNAVDKKILAKTWEETKDNPQDLSLLNSLTQYDIFIHFDFLGKHWYEFPQEFISINHKMLDDFIRYNEQPKGYVLQKSLVKTISSPDKDCQFPGFSVHDNYRTMLFPNLECVENLFYAIDYISHPTISPSSTDIKISILPRGDHLQASQYLEFQKNNYREGKSYESRLSDYDFSANDDLFTAFEQEISPNIVQFDFIFTRKGGSSSPDVDLIEISGLDRSFLEQVMERIRHIKRCLEQRKNAEIISRMNVDKAKEQRSLDIVRAFFNVLDGKRNKALYQNHLTQNLPKIYTASYFRDNLLLSKFVETVQYQIRQGENYYGFFKYDFYLLLEIQNTQEQGENLMNIQQSPSYEMGMLLGKMAKPLRQAINSFEKSYVGNLSRRIVTLADLVQFKNYIDEKNVIHNKVYPSVRECSLLLAEKIKKFEGVYNKEECAFGFFESYFSRHQEGENS